MLNIIRSSQQISKLSRVVSGTERIGLSWPEPPLHLLSPSVLERATSFKPVKSFNATKSFRATDSFKSKTDAMDLLAEIDLEALMKRKTRSPYVKIVSKQMVGIFITVWVRRSVRKHIQNLKVSTVGVGVMGYIGNKIGKVFRGDITILPTLVINNRQYRGKLSGPAVLNAICSGFLETTEPPIFLTPDIETNECLENNGGCWQDKSSNITACRDTFRGRVCECPIVKKLKFVWDGYTHCEASGSLSCEFHNGGCWKQSHGGRLYTACHDDYRKGCECPSGFKGDGVLSCEDPVGGRFGC